VGTLTLEERVTMQAGRQLADATFAFTEEVWATYRGWVPNGSKGPWHGRARFAFVAGSELDQGWPSSIWVDAENPKRWG
jgi:hypothetical protein